MDARNGWPFARLYMLLVALAVAEAFAREGVSWFEEPVSSDDHGLELRRADAERYAIQ